MKVKLKVSNALKRWMSPTLTNLGTEDVSPKTPQDNYPAYDAMRNFVSDLENLSCEGIAPASKYRYSFLRRYFHKNGSHRECLQEVLQHFDKRVKKVATATLGAEGAIVFKMNCTKKFKEGDFLEVQFSVTIEFDPKGKPISMSMSGKTVPRIGGHNSWTSCEP